MMEHRSWPVAVGCLLAAGSLLGITTNLAKVASNLAIAPLAYLVWSLAGATVVLLAVAQARGQRPPINLRTLEFYIVAALLTVAASNLIFFTAVRQVGAGFVALAMTLAPLLTYVGALVLRVESFSAMRAAGVLLALAGAGVLAAKKFAGPGADGLWISLTLFGPVLLATGNLYRTLRWPPGCSAQELVPGMLVAATVMLFGVGAMPGFSFTAAIGDSQVLGLIVVQSAVFASQFLLLFVLQAIGGPVLLSLIGAVAAVVGVPVAVFLLAEAPPAGLFAGSALIGAGIVLVTVGGLSRSNRI